MHQLVSSCKYGTFTDECRDCIVLGTKDDKTRTRASQELELTLSVDICCSSEQADKLQQKLKALEITEIMHHTQIRQ